MEKKCKIIMLDRPFEDIKSKFTEEQINKIYWDIVKDLKSKSLPIIFDTSMKLSEEIKEGLKELIPLMVENFNSEIKIKDSWNKEEVKLIAEGFALFIQKETLEGKRSEGEWCLSI